MVAVRLALPPVSRMYPRRQHQRVASPGAIGGGEPGDLHEQPFAQAGFAVHGGNRVQRHLG
jgi:hypothetical protein